MPVCLAEVERSGTVMSVERRTAIEALAKEPLDVLVIGGGIVGSGVVRDAALRGLRAGLVEQHDFAFGTSSRSSRLLHGGIRYLAQGRIGLVHEASVEKVVISRIAPHLAAPLPFLFPTYQCPPWSPWALWKLRIGVKIYDLLCSGKNLGKSSAFTKETLRTYMASLDGPSLTGAVRYFDGLTNDARLVIDTLRSADKNGAMLANYCQLEEAVPARDGWRCTVRDKLADTSFEVNARTVVNAAGPWAQKLKYSAVQLRLTKGVHLVVDRAKLPIADAVVMTEGPRILFAIPWAERVILGTTDTDYDGVIEDVRTEPEDVSYILGVTNATFSGIGLKEDDVIGAWAGLRPLIADPNGKPSDISRRHEIHEPTPAWFDVAGGKLTTHRLMAEQTVDRLVRRLGRAVQPCRTAKTPLLSSAEIVGLSAIAPCEPSRAVVQHECQNEWAIHLDDVMIRRTSWHYYFKNTDQIAVQACGWMGDALGWNSHQRADELKRYRSIASKGA